MTSGPLDAPLLERTDPALARPLPSPLIAARASVLAAGTALLDLSETTLAGEWPWIGGSDQEVRYGAYRAAEALELAESEARYVLAREEADETQAARIIGPATAARWDLHGLMLSIDESALDTDPGAEEWTIRLAMGHIISSQRAYGWGTAWWLANPHDADDPDLPSGIHEAFWEALPDEATTEAEGNVSELRTRLDQVLDLGAERLAGLEDERLRLAARWSGFAVTVGFRLGRWSSHIREHAIQIEKTMAMLGIIPDESRRLARHVLAAYGRAEATVFGRRPGSASHEAATRLAHAAAEAHGAVASAVEAGRG
ncbi:MAG TPA: DinB family protein [Acidimicrobiia bacterium]|nr:DinB family protein [Acidimicrobiia bacterium]